MSQTPQRLCHTHTFDQHNPLAEKNTLRALILTNEAEVAGRAGRGDTAAAAGEESER